MIRRFLPIWLLLALFSLALPAAAKGDVLIYSVKEARAYAYKASLSKEVIEAASRACNPDTDPYECDESKYNQKPNCPKEIEIGAEGKAPEPEPPEVEPVKGGSGDASGGEEPPPQSTPVRINRYVAISKIGDLGAGVVEAGGLASEMYVDLSGRSEPEAHTESEAFSDNRAAWEERCFAGDSTEPTPENTEHFMSRSDERPGTYHLAECFNRACEFGGGASAEHVLTIVQMWQEDGKAHGRLRAAVDGLTMQEGAFKVDSIVTYVEFESDGTESGMKWSASSTASGVKIAEQEIALPPGRTVSGPGFSVGMAEPYVNVPPDGSELEIVAPGLHFGSTQQSVFFGGAEVNASFGREVPFEFKVGTNDPTVGGGGSGTGSSGLGGGTSGFGLGSTGGVGLGGGTGSTVSAPGEVTDPVAASAPTSTQIFEMPTGVGAVPAILIGGFLAWFLLMSRWLQRFSWGRKMVRLPVFRTIDWLYRAFVKT
jgi:hypothetical protein